MLTAKPVTKILQISTVPSRYVMVGRYSVPPVDRGSAMPLRRSTGCRVQCSGSVYNGLLALLLDLLLALLLAQNLGLLILQQHAQMGCVGRQRFGHDPYVRLRSIEYA